MNTILERSQRMRQWFLTEPLPLTIDECAELTGYSRSKIWRFCTSTDVAILTASDYIVGGSRLLAHLTARNHSTKPSEYAVRALTDALRVISAYDESDHHGRLAQG